MTQDHGQDIAVVTWPAGGESLALALVGAATGAPPRGTSPQAGTGSQAGTAREIVEYEDFPAAAIRRFDEAVAAGEAEDSVPGFLRFASKDFGAFRDFRTTHSDSPPDSPPDIPGGVRRIVLSRAALRADPGAALPRLLDFLGLPRPDAAALAAMVERARPRIAALAAPDPAAFRHHDPALFDLLGRLCLSRALVVKTFRDLTGRTPNAMDILRMQTSATPEKLRAAIAADGPAPRPPAAPAPAQAPAQAPAGSAETPAGAFQPATFGGFARLFDRPPEALAPLPPPAESRPALEAAARAAAAAVTAAQNTYQPLYGLESAGESRREELLRDTCRLLAAEFAAVPRKDQLRILDVGCNAGFVSFVLAETFPNTVGFDVNSDNLALARALKALTGSPALFFETDLLRIADRPDPEFESLDCVLFLNVIHQLIFARGIPYVKSLLGRLSRSVDLIVVELARPAEYVPFGKDALLPLDPAEILEECRDATITLVKDARRPVYTIRRRSLTMGGGDEARVLPYSAVAFGSHPDARVNRKYYFGSDSVTKVIRYSSRQGPGKFRAERDGLARLAGLDVAPRLLASDDDGTMGRIAMQRLYGPSLRDAVRTVKPARRPGLLAEVIRIGAALAERGICQNDFSTHNFILQTDGSLRMIDFELSGREFQRDPFAMLLWIAHNIRRGAPESYRHVDAARLRLKEGPGGGTARRVDRAAYPPADPAGDEAAFGPVLAAILDEAATTEAPWPDFIAGARARLAASGAGSGGGPGAGPAPAPQPASAPRPGAARPGRLASLFSGTRK